MDLTTRYLGLELRSPLVASAGPLSQTVTGVKALADGGVGAVVLYSVFEEQVRSQMEREVELMQSHEESFAEALSYFPDVPGQSDSAVPAAYLSLLERSATAAGVPVIASLNGSTMGGWTAFASQLQDAGAAAIELNIYFVPGDLHTPGTLVEDRHVEILQAVKQAVSIPVAVKLSPFFSSPGALALRLDQAGADGLVLFNRFLQPDIDIDTMAVVPGVALSSPFEARLPRTWIASLRDHVKASLAATSGVETADDVVKYLLAGADVVMSTSALVRHGAGYAAELLQGLTAYLDQKGFASLDGVRGRLAVPADADANAYARSGYVSALQKAKTTYGSLT